MSLEQTAKGRSKPTRRRDGIGLWPLPRDAWAAIVGVGLLYLGHVLYGALVSDVALTLGLGAGIAVLASLASPTLRDDLLRLKGLAAPAALFFVVILVALWTLTPWTPGGPHPIWAYVGISPGASTIDKSSTLMEIIKLLGLACFFLLGTLAGGRDERARFAIRLTIAVGVIFALWAFIGAETGTIQQTGGRRLEAHFYNPNTAGTFFASLVLLSIGEFTREWRARPGPGDLATVIPIGTATMVFVACLLASASRGAVMAALAGAVVFLLVQLAAGRIRLSKALLAALATIALLLVAVSLMGERLLDRLFHSQEDAVVRTAVWSAHWRAFLASPLFGYGLGSAETVNRTLLNDSNFGLLWNIRAILNVYLQWLEEAGLVGAIPMFLCVALLIALALRGALRRSRMTGSLAALVGVDALFVLHGAADFGLEVTSIAALWSWLLGLQVSLAQGTSQR